jgi:hypothetical protein
MRTRFYLVGALMLLIVGCFSPAYHDGNLQCTTSGQCPKDLYCAADNTCWHNGRGPDVGVVHDDAGNAQVGKDAVSDPSIDQAADFLGDAEIVSFDVRLRKDLSGGPDSIRTDTLDTSIVVVPDAPALTDGPDAGNDETGNGGVQLEQLAAEYARVVCAKNFACCTQSDLKGKTLASCEQNVTSLFQIPVQAISDGIDRGRTIYYPERASQCLKIIGDMSCNNWPIDDPGAWLPRICENTIGPQVVSGGACRTAAECTTGLCTGASSTADGTCLPRAASGKSCVQIIGQNSCQRELYCDSTGTCFSTKEDGLSCSQNRECKSQTCNAAPDAGNLCFPATCYSPGPLLSPACSFGGRPSAFVVSLVLAVLALLIHRRQTSSRRRG